jgi:GT2 family glycosyltransferase
VNAPAITAVVVVHSSSVESVADSVQSLLDSVDVDVRVVLVDNASGDGGQACQPWQSHPSVTVVRSEQNLGFAGGVNLGLRQRRAGDLVFLLNDDAAVEPHTLRMCTDALANHPDAVAVAPRVMLADEPDRIDSIGVVLRPNGEAFNAYIGQPWRGQVAEGTNVLGPCFSAGLFRADAFDDRAVGPLDERYHLYYEDIDWVLRAQRRGLTTIAAPGALVHHRHAGSTRKLGEPARYELVQRNLLLCATKNLSPRSVVRVWGTRLIVHAKGVITGPYRLERIRAIARAIAGAPSALAARRGLPRPRAHTDDELFAYSIGQSPQFDPETLRTTPTR